MVLVAAAGTGFFFWRRNRKAKAKATAAESKSSEATQNGGQGVTEFYKPLEEQSEIGGNPVSQLHAEDARQEAGGEMVHQMGDNENAPVAELDGRSRPQELSTGPSVRRPSRDER